MADAPLSEIETQAKKRLFKFNYLDDSIGYDIDRSRALMTAIQHQFELLFDVHGKILNQNQDFMVLFHLARYLEECIEMMALKQDVEGGVS